MKQHSTGFSLLELLIVVSIILILAVFSIPILSRFIVTYKTRATAEAVAQVFYQARQAAITFGRRSMAAGPIRVYMIPATSDKGVGLWFDRNNTEFIPTAGSLPPESEIYYAPISILIGNDLNASQQCALSAGTPFPIVEFNSRGEIPIMPTVPTPPCLTEGTFPVDVFVESTKGNAVTTRYLVGISLSGSVSVQGM